VVAVTDAIVFVGGFDVVVGVEVNFPGGVAYMVGFVVRESVRVSVRGIVVVGVGVGVALTDGWVNMISRSRNDLSRRLILTGAVDVGGCRSLNDGAALAANA
jgi:hypothetical protein